MKSPTISASTTTGWRNWVGLSWARHPDFGHGRCYERRMSTGCRDCRAGLDHCHGTMIHHGLHRSECTEPGCTTPELMLHSFVVDCESVGCQCWDESIAVAV